MSNLILPRASAATQYKVTKAGQWSHVKWRSARVAGTSPERRVSDM